MEITQFVLIIISNFSNYQYHFLKKDTDEKPQSQVVTSTIVGRSLNNEVELIELTITYLIKELGIIKHNKCMPHGLSNSKSNCIKDLMAFLKRFH